MNLTKKPEIYEHVLHTIAQNIQKKFDIGYKNDDGTEVLSQV